MKKLSITIAILLIPIFCHAYTWESIGPTDVNVNEYYTGPGVEVLCTSDGMLVRNLDDWDEYSNGNLPIWDVMEFDNESILVIMGDGSWSDGIYRFNLTNQEFEVLEWCVRPRFLAHSLEHYYVGYEYGLFRSENGLDWVEVDDFAGQDCLALAWTLGCFNSTITISTANNIYYSHDDGQTWNLAPAGVPFISDMAFDYNWTLYGIFPGHSNSSGLWYSPDFGQTWAVESRSHNASIS
ncbi:MAG: hypothetical protein GY869_32075, partial [Planctomycetes bacterium]|nr:hypothetical protein [Planctomycetota bacterium]